MLGIGNTAAFGIDENAFKTRDERRVAKQARQREQQVETSQLLKQLEVKDRRDDTQLETRARQTVGRPRDAVAPTGFVAPSAESSGLKALALRA